MPKQIASDVFETLGGTVKATAKQATDDLKGMREDVAAELGISSSQKPSTDDTNKAQENPAEAEVRKKQSEQKAMAKYRQIQKEIKALENKRKEEQETYHTGPVGQKTEASVKQLEEKPASLPLQPQRAARRTEIHRGVGG